jgi:hypothetical protein
MALTLRGKECSSSWEYCQQKLVNEFIAIFVATVRAYPVIRVRVKDRAGNGY